MKKCLSIIGMLACLCACTQESNTEFSHIDERKYVKEVRRSAFGTLETYSITDAARREEESKVDDVRLIPIDSSSFKSEEYLVKTDSDHEYRIVVPDLRLKQTSEVVLSQDAQKVTTSFLLELRATDLTNTPDSQRPTPLASKKNGGVRSSYQVHNGSSNEVRPLLTRLSCPKLITFYGSEDQQKGVLKLELGTDNCHLNLPIQTQGEALRKEWNVLIETMKHGQLWGEGDLEWELFLLEGLKRISLNGERLEKEIKERLGEGEEFRRGEVESAVSHVLTTVMESLEARLNEEQLAALLDDLFRRYFECKEDKCGVEGDYTRWSKERKSKGNITFEFLEQKPLREILRVRKRNRFRSFQDKAGRFDLVPPVRELGEEVSKGRFNNIFRNIKHDEVLQLRLDEVLEEVMEFEDPQVERRDWTECVEKEEDEFKEVDDPDQCLEWNQNCSRWELVGQTEEFHCTHWKAKCCYFEGGPVSGGPSRFRCVTREQTNNNWPGDCTPEGCSRGVKQLVGGHEECTGGWYNTTCRTHAKKQVLVKEGKCLKIAKKWMKTTVFSSPLSTNRWRRIQTNLTWPRSLLEGLGLAVTFIQRDKSWEKTCLLKDLDTEIVDERTLNIALRNTDKCDLFSDETYDTASLGILSNLANKELYRCGYVTESSDGKREYVCRVGGEERLRSTKGADDLRLKEGYSIGIERPFFKRIRLRGELVSVGRII